MQWPPPRPLPISDPSMREHLDAGLAHQRVGELVALVGDDDAGLQRDDVVAVVPLLALGLPRVAAGLDDPQLLELQRVLDRAQERVLLRTSSSPSLSPGRTE